jgi:rare lipoprotein A (peptidoglycan hydrolase)
MRSIRPHAISMYTAVSIGNNKRGTANVRINPLTERNVKIAVHHVSFDVCLTFPFSVSASSDMWRPAASANPSATAMTIIPDITAVLEDVAAYRPMIKPIAVITPEVSPKETPVMI